MIKRRRLSGNCETVRPSFLYSGGETGPNTWDNSSIQLQLLEDIRNNIEELRQSQMLQCDVAHAIKECAQLLRCINKKIVAPRKRGKGAR